jgi:hypothetical protein
MNIGMQKLLIALALLTSGYSWAQVVPRNILAKKYDQQAVAQALIPLDQWKPYPKTATEWKQKLQPGTIDTLVRAGEAAVGKPIPEISATLLLEFVRTGDRSKHGAASFGRRNMLMDLVLAESVEDNGRFTEAIANLVWAICEETYWGVPAHLSVQKAKNGLPDAEDPTVDLFAAETAAVLAWTDYFVGEKLDKVSPLLRPRIYFETNRKIFGPIKQSDRYGYLSKTKPVNNWNPWIVSNLLVADLLLEKDAGKRAEYAHSYLGFLDSYLNSLGDDGGCDEGPSYWFAAGACVFDALETLTNATSGKIDIYQEPIIRNMAAYVYKVHIADDYFVNFADADPKLKPDGLMLYRFGKALNDPQLTAFGQWGYKRFGAVIGGTGYHRQRKIGNMLTIAEIKGTAETTFKPVQTAWLSDIQVLTARADNGLYLATHGGHNAESHNHNDVGDFIVYADGEPVIVDAGRGNYTARTFSSKRYELWFTQSEYHNLPVVNGKGQVAGRKYEARNVKSMINEKEASLSMDIAPSYSSESGLNFWNRTVRLNRSKSNIEIFDNYELKQQADSLRQVFMTVCKVNTSTPGKVTFETPGKKRVTLSYDPKIWNLTTEFPSTEGMEYSSFKTKWDGPVQRIILNEKAPGKNGKVRYLITKE